MSCLSSRTVGISAAGLVALVAFALPARAGFSVKSSTSPSFTLTLNGSDQSGSYMMQLTVDNSALGVSLTGWNLAITSTQFSTGANALASSASTMTGASATCSGVCTSPPVSSVPYPVAVPAGPGPPAAVKFFNAATATGVGTFTITPTINVAVPANTFAGTYSTTLTLAIASGP